MEEEASALHSREQYLYFCTSKASKLSTNTALQSLESHLERCMEEASAHY
jgi:hypothetical protein